MVLHFRFTFKPFLGHAQKRERARERERERQHGREIAPAPSTDEGEIDPHPRAPTNPENPRPSSFVKQCPNRQIANPFLRLSSSSVEPIPQIANPFLRSSSSSVEPIPQIANPFLRSSSSSVEPIPQITDPNRPPEIVPPNHRSACSGSILLWVDLVADPLAL